MHTPNKSNPSKTNPTQKTPNTAHCRQSVKQTAQRIEKVVEPTVPDKNRSGALNAMPSARREDKRHKGSRASNARQNGDVRDGKLSEQLATKRRRYGREVERATRDATGTRRTGKRAKKRATQRNGTVGKNGRELRSERTMLADHSKNTTDQPSRNSRTILSHTLGRRREATARQSNLDHYGAITTNLFAY